MRKRARSMQKQVSKMASAQRRASRKARRTVSRNISGAIPSTIFGIPIWAVASIGVAAVGGFIYGLMRIDSFSKMMNPVIHDVGEFFGLTEEHGIDTTNITHDRIYNSAIRS